MVEHLTKSELAIMEVMWDQEDALTATEIIKVSGDKEWKNSSVHLLVNALLEKKFIEVVGFKKTTKNYGNYGSNFSFTCRSFWNRISNLFSRVC